MQDLEVSKGPKVKRSKSSSIYFLTAKTQKMYQFTNVLMYQWINYSIIN